MREQRRRNQNWMLLCLCVPMFCTSGAWADFTFGEPVNLGAPINTPLDEGTPMISLDGLSLYYVSDGPGDNDIADIWVSKRKSAKDAWEPGASLGPIVNSSDLDAWPYICADGLTLYFNTSFSIWQTTRPTVDDDWTPPVKLGAPINSSDDDINPCISADGLEFYFASSRHRPNVDWDLYVCRRESVQDAWGEPIALSVLNSNSYDHGPSLSADGLAMFFNSWRAVGLGEGDIYMTRRESIGADWSPPVNIGLPVNSSYTELAPRVSPDGRTLYFCDNPYYALRPGGMGGGDIWTASIDPIVDFNGDRIVDAEDMCIIVNHWGEDYPLCDIGPMPWGDGVVDVQDLIVLSEHLFEDFRLIAHWELDETEGSIAYDSININDGICLGEPLWMPEGGKVGGALQFDGIDDYVSIPFVLNPGEGSFSVFAWTQGRAPGQAIVSQGNNTIGPDNTWLGMDLSDGKLITRLMHPPFAPLESESVITDGQWHHVGLVYDRESLCRHLYVDGAEVASDMGPVAAIGSDGGLYIGAGETLGANSFFSGLIDDIRIYNVALTPEEIAALAR